MDALERCGITAREPVSKPLAAHASASIPDMVRAGVFKAFDPGYRERACAAQSTLSAGAQPKAAA